MARTIRITTESIIDGAFEIARNEGLSEVTARRVASHLDCSTQPIFRTFSGMNELLEKVYEKALNFYGDFYSLYPRLGSTPFSNLGMAYIAFAKQERNLFNLLFVENLDFKKGMYEVLNQDRGYVVNEMSLAAASGCPDAEGLFMKMWIFIHGAACMSLSGEYDLSDSDTLTLLEQTYDSFVKNI